MNLKKIIYTFNFNFILRTPTNMNIYRKTSLKDVNARIKTIILFTNKTSIFNTFVNFL